MKIGIVAPSGPPTALPDRKEYYSQGLATLKNLGFECVESEHATDQLSYVSASIEDRLADIHAMYRDSSIQLILAANGGRNCNQLLTGLDWDIIASNPKPFAGYSDTTVLLNALYARTDKVQLHSPMVGNGFNANDPMTNQSFLHASQKQKQMFLIDQFGYCLRPGELQGKLVGGNIISLQPLLGTAFEPDWQGKIFFWEETQESINSLDRVLTHFRNAGVWDKIQGMVIGNLNKINESYAGKTYDSLAMIKNHFKDYTFPIIKTQLFGHNILPNITLPIGGTFSLEGGVVSVDCNQ